MKFDPTPWGEAVRHYFWQENYPKDTAGIKFHFYTQPTPPHDHDFFDIFVVTEGPVGHQFGTAEPQILGTGSLGIARPQDIHRFLTIPDTHSIHFNIMISEPVFRSVAAALSEDIYALIMAGGEKPFRQLSPSELEHLRSMTDAVISANDTTQPMLLRALTALLLSYLFDGRQLGDEGDWLTDFIQRIHSSEHFLRPISELYHLVPYSRSVLNARFKEHTGLTLIAYVTRLRMEYACTLLVSSDYPIIDVAEATSYDSLSHFNHTFKREIGMTPTEFRKRSRRGKIENM